MDFLSFHSFRLSQNDTHVITATKWRGESIGHHDTMDCFFYAADTNCPTNAPNNLRFDLSSYCCEVMKNENLLMAAFARWLRANSDDTAIVVTSADYEVLQRLSNDDGFIDLDNDFECIVNIDEVWPLRDYHAYAERHGIRPCRAMMDSGGFPIWAAAVKAQCYRLLLSAVGLHEYPATDLAIVQRCHALPGLV